MLSLALRTSSSSGSWHPTTPVLGYRKSHILSPMWIWKWEQLAKLNRWFIHQRAISEACLTLPPSSKWMSPVCYQAFKSITTQKVFFLNVPISSIKQISTCWFARLVSYKATSLRQTIPSASKSVSRYVDHQDTDRREICNVQVNKWLKLHITITSTNYSFIALSLFQKLASNSPFTTALLIKPL